MKKPWLILLAAILSSYFVYLEVGDVLLGENEQGTLYHSYNSAFYNQFLDEGGWPQWNPYIQSGVSHHANLPFPLSLSNISTLLSGGDGVLGYFISRTIILIIGSFFLVSLLNKLGVGTLSCLLTLFLFLFFQRSHNSHEAVPTHVALVMVYATLSFVHKPQFYKLGLASIFLGLILNDYVSQGVFGVIPFQIALVFFMREQYNWKTHATAVFIIWSFGLMMGLPTLVPQIIDVQQSSKIYTPQLFVSNDIIADMRSFLNVIFVMKLSPSMIIPLAMAIGSPFIYWDRYKSNEKGFIKSLFFILAVVLSFSVMKSTLISIPIIGGVFAAIDSNRLMYIVHLAIEIAFAISLQQLMSNSTPSISPVWRSGLFAGVYLLLLACLMHYLSAYEMVSSGLFQGYILVLGAIFIAIYGRSYIRHFSLAFIALVFIKHWSDSGIIATKILPVNANPFKPIETYYTSIFPNEESIIEQKMVNFLRSQAQKDHFTTAELRNHVLGHDMFQRYPYLEIPSVHGLSSVRSLRTHMLYIWMLDDLRIEKPKWYTHLLMWGNFAYNYGTAFDKDLLNLMGVRYLIANRDTNDERFKIALEGNKYRIFENMDAFPRTFTVEHSRQFKTLETMGSHMRDTPSEVLREEVVYLEEDIRVFGEERVVDVATKFPSLHDGIDRLDDAKIIKFTPNQVAVEVEVGAPSILILTQSFHRGWSVTIDGMPGEIYPAYYAFLSTVVPEGKSIVRFVFSDTYFVMGLYVGLTAFFAMISISVIDRINPLFLTVFLCREKV